MKAVLGRLAGGIESAFEEGCESRIQIVNGRTQRTPSGAASPPPLPPPARPAASPSAVAHPPAGACTDNRIAERVCTETRDCRDLGPRTLINEMNVSWERVGRTHTRSHRLHPRGRGAKDEGRGKNREGCRISTCMPAGEGAVAVAWQWATVQAADLRPSKCWCTAEGGKGRLKWDCSTTKGLGHYSPRHSCLVTVARSNGAACCRLTGLSYRSIHVQLPQVARLELSCRPQRPAAGHCCFRGRRHQTPAWGSCRPTPPRAAGCRR